MTMTVSIPFPAWDGIFKVNDVCGEFRRNPMFEGCPIHPTPRRITMKTAEIPAGFDDCKVVELWFTQGTYAAATLGGIEDTHYGWGWRLVSLRLRWQQEGLGLPDGKVEVKLGAEQLGPISFAAYCRSHLGVYKGLPSLPQAQAQLEGASRESDALIDAVAAPIQRAYEKNRIWWATRDAELEGREFSWLPGQESA